MNEHHWVQVRVLQRLSRPRRLHGRSPEQAMVAAFAKTGLTLSHAQIPTHSRSTVTAPRPVARTGHDHGLFVFTGPHIRVATLVPLFLNVSTPDGFVWQGWDDFDDIKRVNAIFVAISSLTVHASTAADLLDRVAVLVGRERGSRKLWVDQMPALTEALRSIVSPEERAAIDLLTGLGAFDTDRAIS